jgi:hypothetical protein
MVARLFSTAADAGSVDPVVIAAPPNKVAAAMRAAPIADFIVPHLSCNGNSRRITSDGKVGFEVQLVQPQGTAFTQSKPASSRWRVLF